MDGLQRGRTAVPSSEGGGIFLLVGPSVARRAGGKRWPPRVDANPPEHLGCWHQPHLAPRAIAGAIVDLFRLEKTFETIERNRNHEGRSSPLRNVEVCRRRAPFPKLCKSEK